MNGLAWECRECEAVHAVMTCCCCCRQVEEEALFQEEALVQEEGEGAVSEGGTEAQGVLHERAQA